MSKLLGAAGHHRGYIPDPGGPPTPPPPIVVPGYIDGWDLSTISTSRTPPPDLVGKDADFTNAGAEPYLTALGKSYTRVPGVYLPKANGEIIYGLDVDGIDFAGAGKSDVIAVNCKVRGIVSGRPDAQMWGCTWGRTAPGDTKVNGFRYTMRSIRRCNWYGFLDTAQINNTSGLTFLVRDNLLHDLSIVTDTSQSGGISHNDGFQVIMGGNLSLVHNNYKGWGFYAKGGETTPGTSFGPNTLRQAGPSTDYVTNGWINSFLILNNRAAPTAAQKAAGQPGDLLNIHDILVDDNLIDGNLGAIAHLAWPEYDVFRVVISGNRIVRKCWTGAGPISGPKGTAWTDGGKPNKYLDGTLAF